jgi:hypothetical protein
VGSASFAGTEKRHDAIVVASGEQIEWDAAVIANSKQCCAGGARGAAVDLTQHGEQAVAKVDVEGSNPFSRSKSKSKYGQLERCSGWLFCLEHHLRGSEHQSEHHFLHWRDRLCFMICCGISARTVCSSASTAFDQL